MDSLSSFGKVRTMEEDLAAARNKQRLPSDSRAPEKVGALAAKQIAIPVAPVPPTRGPMPVKPPLPPQVARPSAQIPPAPGRAIPAPPSIPAQPQVRPAPPSTPKPPTAPTLLQKEEKLPAPKPVPAPATISPPLPPARQAVPPSIPKQPTGMPAMPSVPVPPRQNVGGIIGRTPAQQNLARVLPVEEEESGPVPPAEVKKPPPAATTPSPEKIVVPARQQIFQPSPIPTAPQPPKAPVPISAPPVKGATPEEILGMRPSAPSQAGGPRVGTAPLPPVAPRIMPTGKPLPEMVPAAQVSRPGRSTPPTSPPPTIYQSPYIEKRGAPFILITGIVMIILAAGGFFVWRATHPGTPPPPPAPIVAPSPFFKPDSTNTITLQQGKESFLIEQIRALENTPGNAQSIAYLPIKKSSNGNFLQTKEFFSTIGVSIPQELLDDVDNQFMLYLYTPGAEERARCASENMSNTSCYSPRLGIVLKINTGKQGAVQNIMSGLEPTLVQAFRPLILDAPAFDKATAWDTATHAGVSVRFSNLPISTTSLNWAQVGDYLIIATSKNSSYTALDKLAPSTLKNVSNTNPNVTASGADIDRVRIILADMRQAYLTGNKTVYDKYASAATLAFFSSKDSRIQFGNVFTVSGITQSGSNIVADITTDSGNTGIVFIKEGGDWRYDLNATFQYAIDQNNAKKGTGNPSGLPDFAVTSVTVSPSHPVVNSKDVAITINIKNIGTKTADNGTAVVAKLIGFTKEVPSTMTLADAIAPGETVTDIFTPYKENGFFKISDTPGQKTIQITLNPDHAVTESNYDNNVFTQTVQMYSK